MYRMSKVAGILQHSNSENRMHLCENRDPPTTRGVAISIADGRRQVRSNTPSTQKEKVVPKYDLFFLVEAAGIEPASEKPLTELSPGAGHLLNFPGLAADARAA